MSTRITSFLKYLTHTLYNTKSKHIFKKKNKNYVMKIFKRQRKWGNG